MSLESLTSRALDISKNASDKQKKDLCNSLLTPVTSSYMDIPNSLFIPSCNQVIARSFSDVASSAFRLFRYVRNDNFDNYLIECNLVLNLPFKPCPNKAQIFMHRDFYFAQSTRTRTKRLKTNTLGFPDQITGRSRDRIHALFFKKGYCPRHV